MESREGIIITIIVIFPSKPREDRGSILST